MSQGPHEAPISEVPLPNVGEVAPGVTAAQQQQMEADAAEFDDGRPLNVRDALHYLDKVRQQFSTDDVGVYDRFLAIMKDFKTQTIDTPGVIDRVSALFKGHPQLIEGFNTFLPPGYRVVVNDSNASITVTTPQGTSIRQHQDMVEEALEAPAPAPAPAAPAAPAAPVAPVHEPEVAPPIREPEPVRPAREPEPAPPAAPRPTRESEPSAPTPAAPNKRSGHTLGRPPIYSPTAGYARKNAAAPLPVPATPLPPLNQPAPYFAQQQPQQPQQPQQQPYYYYPQQTTPAPPAPAGAPHDGPPAVEFNHAINYVNKIKSRFINKPETYKSFLEVLQTYQKEARGIKENYSQVYAQVTELFKDAPDLLDEFKAFLPDTSENAAQPPPPPGAPAPAPQHTMYEVATASRRASAGKKSDEPAKEPASAKKRGPPSLASSERKNKRRSGPAPAPSHPEFEQPMAPIPEYQPQPEMYYPPYFNPQHAQQHPQHAPHAPHPQHLIPPPAMPAYTDANPLVNNSEFLFFERIKKLLNNKALYAEFLKVLGLFTAGVITDARTLLEHALPFLEGDGELVAQFKDLIGYDVTRDGRPATAEWDIDNIPYQVRPNIDLFTAPMCCVSYRKLPRTEVDLGCSGRGPLEWSVLNDEYVASVTWSSETNAHRKNMYEESLFSQEQERHWFSFYLSALQLVVVHFECLAARLVVNGHADDDDLTLDETFGQFSSPGILRGTLERVYGKDHRAEIIAALQQTPVRAVPVVLARLKQKQQEWLRTEKEWKKIWHEIDVKNHYRALDHAGYMFKARDKKTTLTTRSLVNEIVALKAAKKQRRYDAQGEHEVSIMGKVPARGGNPVGNALLSILRKSRVPAVEVSDVPETPRGRKPASADAALNGGANGATATTATLAPPTSTLAPPTPTLPSPNLLTPAHTSTTSTDSRASHPVHAAPFSQSQLVYSYADRGIFYDVLRLTMAYLERDNGYSSPERSRLEGFLRHFVPLFFQIPEEELHRELPRLMESDSGETSERSEDEGEGDSGDAIGAGDADDVVEMRDAPESHDVSAVQSPQEMPPAPHTPPSHPVSRVASPVSRGASPLASRGPSPPASRDASPPASQPASPHTDASSPPSTSASPSPHMPSTPFSEQPWIKLVSSNRPSGNVRALPYYFYANASFYGLLRMFATAYFRLLRFKRECDRRAESHYQRLNPRAVELGLCTVVHEIDEGENPAEGYYTHALTLCTQLFDGDIDQNSFEEQLRYMVGIEAYPLFTVDKVISSMIKYVHAINGDARSRDLLRLLERERAAHGEDMTLADLVTHRMEAEAIVEGSDDALYRIEIDAAAAVLAMDVVDKGDVTITSDVSDKYNTYLTSYSLTSPTENVGLTVSAPLLRRNRERRAVGSERDFIAGSNLAAYISPVDYKLTFVNGTGDFFVRRKPHVPVDAAANARKLEKLNAFVEAARAKQ